MDMLEAQSWAFLIASFGTVVVSTITAWRVGRVQTQGESIEKKVDVVHDATNSRLALIDNRLQTALAEIATMRAVAAEAEKARVALATSVVPLSSPVVSEMPT